MSIIQISAEKEYSKNPDLSREDVRMLREWLEKQPHLPQIDDEQLILFLHSCYYRVEFAKTTIDTYFTVRTHCPEFFSDRDVGIASVHQAMEIAVYSALPELTKEGYKVIFCRLVDSDSSRYVYADTLKVFSMIVDLMLAEEGTANGHIIVFDMAGVTFGHMTKMSVVTMKKFLFYLQEALPFRLKGLHFINVVSFIDKLLAIMKPFMKKELLDIFHLHIDSNDKLYDFVPKKCMPKDYGGEAESISQLHEKMMKKLSANTKWFANEENLRVVESKRPGKAKSASDLFGVEGSFKKLDID